MKLNKFLKYTAVSALTLATGIIAVSCTDNFEELNTNQYELDPNTLPFSAQFQEPMSYVYAPQQNLFQFCFSLTHIAQLISSNSLKFNHLIFREALSGALQILT